MGTEEENREANKNILALWGSWWVSKNHVTGEKPPNLVMGDWREKSDKKPIDEKPLGLDWGSVKGKPKDHKI